VFDGAGTKWVGTLAVEGHPLHQRFVEVQGAIAGACRFCARAFGATQDVQAAGIPLLGEYEGHPSIRTLVVQGYQVITF
jgi:hypothetical protein